VVVSLGDCNAINNILVLREAPDILYFKFAPPIVSFFWASKTTELAL